MDFKSIYKVNLLSKHFLEKSNRNKYIWDGSVVQKKLIREISKVLRSAFVLLIFQQFFARLEISSDSERVFPFSRLLFRPIFEWR